MVEQTILRGLFLLPVIAITIACTTNTIVVTATPSPTPTITPTVIPLPTLTPIVIPTPTTTPTPPTPTATPIPLTPTPFGYLDRLDYLTWLSAHLDTFSEISFAIAASLEELDLESPEWRASMRRQGRQLSEHMDRLGDIVPPGALGMIHNLYIDSSHEFIEAGYLLINWINNDPKTVGDSRLDDINYHLSEGLKLMRLANEELNQLP